MSHRNLTELFHMLRNNAVHSRSVTYENDSDNENLLQTPSNSNDEPRWIGKYDDANYFLSKIHEYIDQTIKLQSNEVRSVLSDEYAENNSTIERYIAETKQLIHSCHDSITSMCRAENGLEHTLLTNIQRYCLTTLQSSTEQYRQILANKAARSLKVAEGSLGLEPRADNNGSSSSSANVARHHGSAHNSVETFDNFLQLEADTHGDDGEDQQLDDFFQLPATGLTINQKQIMLIQADNTKMLKSREDEVLRMTNSITDLNVIFKDISNLIQEQGTILDRIDYNIESAQVRVSDGLRQLQTSESYQRRNKKIHCIMLLAMAIMFMIILIIFTKL